MPIPATTTLFDPSVVNEIVRLTRGRSALARLSPSRPIPFSGERIFTFALDGEVAIVGESAAKPHQGLTVAPINVTPLKVTYQARVPDEFLRASRERQIDILANYIDGFGRKLAVGIDKIFLHGLNPYSGEVSSLVQSYADAAVTNTVTLAANASADAAVQTAIALLGDYDNTGMALSRNFANALAAETIGTTGVPKFPELQWGGDPERLRGIPTAVSANVGPADEAIIGDFAYFRWGYSGDIKYETIEYGDPDNSGVDLKGHNQVMLRAEAYIGGAWLVPDAFVRIIPPAAGSSEEP